MMMILSFIREASDDYDQPMGKSVQQILSLVDTRLLMRVPFGEPANIFPAREMRSRLSNAWVSV